MLAQEARLGALNGRRPPVGSNTEATVHLHTPLKLGVAWLAGTYLLFLILGQVGKVPDLAKLTGFVAATIATFSAGYWLRARKYVGLQAPQLKVDSIGEVLRTRRWVIISAAYLAVAGIAQLLAHGADGPDGVLQAILHPGTAYFARLRGFDVEQAADSSPNTVVQVLTLCAGLSTPLVPLAVLYWRRLTLAPRVAAIAGGGLYASYWLFIGTLKGLGDMLLYAIAALMVLAAWRQRDPRPATLRPRRARWVSSALLLAVFVGYMAFNQSDRLSYIGATDQFEANPVISALTGEEFARGLSVSAFYPTNGYLGLAYNLDTPFVWSHGLGASRALNSYWVRYVGGQTAEATTYPARTEVRTGWPAGMYWATIYPWLASDLGFPGAVVFMGLVGWWLARFWYEAVFLRSKVALLMLCQLTLLLGYVPANNQIGLTAPGLIAFVSLSLVYAIKRPGRT